MVIKDGFHTGGSIMKTSMLEYLQCIFDEIKIYNYPFYLEIISARICFKIYSETNFPIKYLLNYAVKGDKYDDTYNIYYLVNKDMNKTIKYLLDSYVSNEIYTVSYLSKKEYVIESIINEYRIFCEEAMNYFEIVCGNTCVIIARTENDKVVHQLLYIYRDILFRTCINKKGLLLHAACIVYNSKAYLLLGDKGAGKTTILINCITSLNCQAIANDRAIILDNSIFPFPMPLRIGRNTILNNPKLFDYLNRSFDKLTRKHKSIISFADYIGKNSQDKIELTLREFEECFSFNTIENIELGGIFVLENTSCSEIFFDRMGKDCAFCTVNKQNYSVRDPLWNEPWIVKYKCSKTCLQTYAEKEIKKIIERVPVYNIKYNINSFYECVEKIGYLLKG